MTAPASTLILGLLFFWALWFTLVLLTNAAEGLKMLGVLPPGWKFTSDNYTLIHEATADYSFPEWANRLLFSGVVAWQGLAAVLLWAAFGAAARSLPAAWDSIYTAFAASIGLWAAFLIADEAFQAYRSESKHQLVFIAQLVTLVAIRFLAG